MGVKKLAEYERLFTDAPEEHDDGAIFANGCNKEGHDLVKCDKTFRLLPKADYDITNGIDEMFN